MILLFFTGFEDLWKNCDDGRIGENEFDGPGKFFIPSPVYLTASDIPKGYLNQFIRCIRIIIWCILSILQSTMTHAM